jgi:hypothetical protein
MDLHLRGQTAIVIGASRGIGLAIIRGLVVEGVLVIAGADKSSADPEAGPQGGRAHGRQDLPTTSGMPSPAQPWPRPCRSRRCRAGSATSPSPRRSTPKDTWYRRLAHGPVLRSTAPSPPGAPCPRGHPIAAQVQQMCKESGRAAHRRRSRRQKEVSRPVGRVLCPACAGRRSSIWDCRCRQPRAVYPRASGGQPSSARAGRLPKPAALLTLLRVGFT